MLSGNSGLWNGVGHIMRPNTIGIEYENHVKMPGKTLRNFQFYKTANNNNKAGGVRVRSCQVPRVKLTGVIRAIRVVVYR